MRENPPKNSFFFMKFWLHRQHKGGNAHSGCRRRRRGRGGRAVAESERVS